MSLKDLPVALLEKIGKVATPSDVSDTAIYHELGILNLRAVNREFRQLQRDYSTDTMFAISPACQFLAAIPSLYRTMDVKNLTVGMHRYLQDAVIQEAACFALQQMFDCRYCKILHHFDIILTSVIETIKAHPFSLRVLRQAFGILRWLHIFCRADFIASERRLYEEGIVRILHEADFLLGFIPGNDFIMARSFESSFGDLYHFFWDSESMHDDFVTSKSAYLANRAPDALPLALGSSAYYTYPHSTIMARGLERLRNQKLRGDWSLERTGRGIERPENDPNLGGGWPDDFPTDHLEPDENYDD